jgi:transketolase
MRDAFVRELTRIAIEDERVVVLTADLGIGLFDEISEAAPGRFLNVGIAEQNMVGIAAGMALAGRRVFVYSIAPFVTSRPHDQVRVDVAYHQADVTIVGVGGGVAYGSLGPTHHAIEDLALMRALPNMTVIAPGSPSEAASATRALAEHRGPAYLRLAKNGEPECLADEPFRIGVARSLGSGSDLTICTTGAMLPSALEAADRLTAVGIDAGLLHMPTVKPLDVAALADALQSAPLLVTLEDHTLPGGFGSAVAEAVVDHGLGGRMLRLGIPDCFAPVVGSREHLLALYGLSPAGIVDSITLRLRPRIAA